jgi:hypothetical protein
MGLNAVTATVKVAKIRDRVNILVVLVVVLAICEQSYNTVTAAAQEGWWSQVSSSSRPEYVGTTHKKKGDTQREANTDRWYPLFFV